MRTIEVVNQAKTVTGEDFAAAVAAVQAQVTEDFAPVWGLSAKLEGRTALPTDAHEPFVETLYVLDDSDQAGALGYHTMTDQGVIVGFVFARTDRAHGIDWSETLSHEVLEQLVDPWANLLALVTDRAGAPVGVALEVADPCQSATYARLNRPVSDFVYPSWFRRGANPGKLDCLDRLHAPLQLLPGGYIPVTRDLRTWTQAFGEKAPAHHRLPHPLSRSGRRQLRQPVLYSL